MSDSSHQKYMTRGVIAIADERYRQQLQEGWTPDHDDKHIFGDMARAAACYALIGGSSSRSLWTGDIPNFWPWAGKWWKPSDCRRDLVKAGALIAAEIDRLDRAQENAK